MKLFMILLGCRPENRVTEQHDIFFGIAERLQDLKPAMECFWPEAKNNLHIDVWREITFVDGFEVTINQASEGEQRLFFVNLGGYQPSVFDELHQKFLLVTDSMENAAKSAKQTSFFLENTFQGANSHIDEKFELDVDELENVDNLLARCGFQGVKISLKKSDREHEDEIHCGYLPLKNFN